jgi:hypothetical protein
MQHCKDEHRVFNHKLVKKLLRENDKLELINMDRRSKVLNTYVGTVRDVKDITALRRMVRHANRMIKKSESGKGLRVDVKARLGKNSPHAHNYVRTISFDDGFTARVWDSAQRIALKHGARFDFYLYEK